MSSGLRQLAVMLLPLFGLCSCLPRQTTVSAYFERGRPSQVFLQWDNLRSTQEGAKKFQEQRQWLFRFKTQTLVFQKHLREVGGWNIQQQLLRQDPPYAATLRFQLLRSNAVKKLLTRLMGEQSALKIELEDKDTFQSLSLQKETPEKGNKVPAATVSLPGNLSLRCVIIGGVVEHVQGLKKLSPSEATLEISKGLVFPEHGYKITWNYLSERGGQLVSPSGRKPNT